MRRVRSAAVMRRVRGAGGQSTVEVVALLPFVSMWRSSFSSFGAMIVMFGRQRR